MNDSAMLRDWQLAQDVSRRMKEQPTPKSLSSALFVLLLTLLISCGPAPTQTSGGDRAEASRDAPSAQNSMEFFRDLPRLPLIDSDGNPLPVLVPADAPSHTVANSNIGILRAPEFFTAVVFAGAEELLNQAIALTEGADPKYARRIHFARCGLDHTRLLVECRALSEAGLDLD